VRAISGGWAGNAHPAPPCPPPMPPAPAQPHHLKSPCPQPPIPAPPRAARYYNGMDWYVDASPSAPARTRPRPPDVPGDPVALRPGGGQVRAPELARLAHGRRTGPRAPPPKGGPGRSWAPVLAAPPAPLAAGRHLRGGAPCAVLLGRGRAAAVPGARRGHNGPSEQPDRVRAGPRWCARAGACGQARWARPSAALALLEGPRSPCEGARRCCERARKRARCLSSSSSPVPARARLLTRGRAGAPTATNPPSWPGRSPTSHAASRPPSPTAPLRCT
jgi:hypothetical protein